MAVEEQDETSFPEPDVGNTEEIAREVEEVKSQAKNFWKEIDSEYEPSDHLLVSKKEAALLGKYGELYGPETSEENFSDLARSIENEMKELEGKVSGHVVNREKSSQYLEEIEEHFDDKDLAQAARTLRERLEGTDSEDVIVQEMHEKAPENIYHELMHDGFTQASGSMDEKTQEGLATLLETRKKHPWISKVSFRLALGRKNLSEEQKDVYENGALDWHKAVKKVSRDGGLGYEDALKKIINDHPDETIDSVLEKI